MRVNNIDVCLIAESWFTKKHTDESINIPGYNVFRHDRGSRKGGGVCCYVRDNISCSVYAVSNECEIMWLTFIFEGLAYYIACSYHPPKSSYVASEFCAELNKVINQVNLSVMSSDAIIIIAGDFNQLNTSFLEIDHGLVQIVNSVTHGNNVLDRVYTNRPDIYSAHVLKSLIKTKHMAVIIIGTDPFPVSPDPKRQKIAFYDLRAPNINSLRYNVATYDWTMCLQAADIQSAYDIFLRTVHMLIAKTVPVKYVTVGPRDPPFVTPLVKTLLNKRRRLRKNGRIDEANVLAERINLLIRETRSKQLAKLSDASPKQLWASVRRATKTSANEASNPMYLLNDLESVNAYFADVCSDLGYNKGDVLQHSRVPLVDDRFALEHLTVYSVEKLLRQMKHTSPGTDNIPSWFLKIALMKLQKL